MHSPTCTVDCTIEPSNGSEGGLAAAMVISHRRASAPSLATALDARLGISPTGYPQAASTLPNLDANTGRVLNQVRPHGHAARVSREAQQPSALVNRLMTATTEDA